MRFYHFFRVKPLTTAPLYGLMRPVARIAQSVEQGIENPRVLGSIPSPGTTILKNPLKRRVFAFLHPDSSSNEFDHSQNFTYPLPPNKRLLSLSKRVQHFHLYRFYRLFHLFKLLTQGLHFIAIGDVGC